MANYQNYVTAEFDKRLNKINKRDKQLIEKKLKEKILPKLKNEPHYSLNIKKLRNWKPETWRYRIGDFRLFYQIDDMKNEVDIVTIENRKDSY